MYNVHVLRRAEEDIEHAVEWYNEKQQGLGDRFWSFTVKALRKLESNPFLYEERFSNDFRFTRITDFPYMIVYKVKGQIVIVNAVFHTSRNNKDFTRS